MDDTIILKAAAMAEERSHMLYDVQWELSVVVYSSSCSVVVYEGMP
jgi:hypothetical protein